MSRWNADAESAVIGALLTDNGTYDKVSGLVSAADFAIESHREIFSAVEKLILHRMPADVITVANELDQDGALERIGGLKTLGDISQGYYSSSNTHRYADLVRNLSRERSMLIAIGEAHDTIHGDGDTAEKLAKAAESVMQAAETGRKAAHVTSAKDLSRSALKSICDRSASGEDGLSTGFVDLDRVAGRLKAGQLIIVAGRPAMGKSTLARNIAEHVARHVGVLFVSLEMDADELGECFIASLGCASHAAIQAGDTDGEHAGGMAAGATKLGDLKMAIATGADTIPAIHSLARTESRRIGGIGLIVVDYLQQLHVPGSADRRVEVDQISRGLKRLAMTLRVPVIALAQLSRAVEQRSDKRPMLSDLRESGGIEADADKVIGLYRDEYYNDNSDYKGMAEALILKNRRGKTGKVPMVFIGEQSRFEDAAPNYRTEEPKRQPKKAYGGFA